MIRSWKTWRLRAKLKSRDPDVRRLAARKLGEFKDTSAVETLVEALKPDVGEWNWWAAWALGEIGDERALEPLLATIRSRPREEAMTFRAVEALGKIGDEAAAEPLASLLNDDRFNYDPSFSKVVVEALARLGREALGRAISQQVRRLADPQSTLSERGDAARTLDLLDWKPADATEEAFCAVARKEWERAASLGREAVKPLVDVIGVCVRDREKSVSMETVKQAAQQALAGIRDPRAAPALVSALGSWGGPAAEEALAGIGKEAVGPLMEVFTEQTEPASSRAAAAVMLGRIGDPRALKPLVGALRDESPNVRWASARALVRLGWQPADDAERAFQAVALEEWETAVAIGAPAVEPLRLALNTLQMVNVTVSPAADALARIGDAAAVGALLLALRHRSGRLRSAAATALRTLHDQPTQETEKALLCIALREWDAVRLLGAGAVEALITALGYDEPYERERAATTLGELADPRAIEPLSKVARDDPFKEHTFTGFRGQPVQFSDPDSIEIWEHSWPVREAAEAALAKLRRKSTPPGR